MKKLSKYIVSYTYQDVDYVRQFKSLITKMDEEFTDIFKKIQEINEENIKGDLCILTIIKLKN